MYMNFSSEKNVINVCKDIVDNNRRFAIPEESVNELIRKKLESSKLTFDVEFEEYKNINHVSINTGIYKLINKPISPDIYSILGNKKVIIEVKKINTNQAGSDYPYLFRNNKNRLLRTNYYELGQSMLLNHKGFEIITHYQEGQIIHDIMRLLKVEPTDGHAERYIVCFVQNNTSKKMVKPTIPSGTILVERLKTVLDVAQNHFKIPVFTDGYGRTFSQKADGPSVADKYNKPVYALRTPEPGMSFNYEFCTFNNNVQFYSKPNDNSFMACVIKITPDFPPSKA